MPARLPSWPAHLPAVTRAFTRISYACESVCAVYLACAMTLFGSGRQLTPASFVPLPSGAVGPKRLADTQEKKRQDAAAAALQAAQDAESASARGASAETTTVPPSKRKKSKAAAPGAAEGGDDAGYWKSYTTLVVPAAQMQEPTQGLFGPERTYVGCVCCVYVVCIFFAAMPRCGARWVAQYKLTFVDMAQVIFEFATDDYERPCRFTECDPHT